MPQKEHPLCSPGYPSTRHPGLLLPQEDPDFYDDFTLNYNNTDFITGEVPTTPIQWRDAIKADPIPVKADPSVDIDALSGATQKADKN